MKMVNVKGIENVKMQKNTPDNVLKKALSILEAHNAKALHPTKLNCGYGYKYNINKDWRLLNREGDFKDWLIVEHLEYNRLVGVKGAHK